MNKKEKKVPYHKKPEYLSIDEWQSILRKQYALAREFIVNNEGDHPVYSDFSVYNTEKDSKYKIAIRNPEFGENFCSCPDFKINTLGTCKHIEYVLYKLSTNLETSQYLNDNIASPYSSISLRYGIERKIYLRIGSMYENEMQNFAFQYFDSEGFLLETALFSLDEFIEEAHEIDPEFRIYPDAMNFVYNMREEITRKERMNSFFSKGTKSPVFNNLIKANLYEYQREGVIFGAVAGRFLLADEMGLGKTIQAIALAELYIKEFSIKKILIVCPTSLKYQWKSELLKFTEKEALVIEGNPLKRKDMYENQIEYKIISYGIVGNDLEVINNCNFDLVILDEAQRIKNWKTKTAQCVKKLNSTYTIVLTGTPLENRIEELHSIVEFIDRYKLGPLYRFLYNHQLYDKDGKMIGYKGLNMINETLKDVLIRRTKDEIKDQLPGRIDKTYLVPMTDEQWKMHDYYYETVVRLVSKWRRAGVLSREDRDKLLMALNCMRMTCDSTYILEQDHRYDVKIDELVKILGEVFEDKNEKVVIFSQWKRMADLVISELNDMGIKYRYLHGGVHAKKRKLLIEDFHEDPECRVFLSTDAGGVGLNLQCASVIINLDIPWNPAVLEQRIGRVYRLGQKKTVRVVNLVSNGTLEHRILHLLEFKKSVFKGVLEDGDDVVINDTNNKSFMESVEELTEVSSRDFHITPHAEGEGDEEHDYERKSDIKKDRLKNRGSNSKIFSNILKPVGLVSWFVRKVFRR